MENKILALIGSNNPHSINEQLVKYVSGKLEEFEVKLHQWANFEVPVYSARLEKERGIPADIRVLKNLIDEQNILIIAVNEHNKTVSAFFKNIIDWLSRLDRGFLSDKKILLMSASESSSGAINALDYMKRVIPDFGGEVIESFSFPNFSETLDVDQREIQDDVVLLGLMDVLTNFEQNIQKPST